MKRVASDRVRKWSVCLGNGRGGTRCWWRSSIEKEIARDRGASKWIRSKTDGKYFGNFVMNDYLAGIGDWDCLFFRSQINRRNRKKTEQNVEQALAVSSEREIFLRKNFSLAWSVRKSKCSCRSLHSPSVCAHTGFESRLSHLLLFNPSKILQAPQTKETLIRELHLQRAAEEAATKKREEEQRLLVNKQINFFSSFRSLSGRKSEIEKYDPHLHTHHWSPNRNRLEISYSSLYLSLLLLFL